MKFISIISALAVMIVTSPVSARFVRYARRSHGLSQRGFAIHIYSEDEGRRRVSNLRELACQ
jgi:hypothetical protein